MIAPGLDIFRRGGKSLCTTEAQLAQRFMASSLSEHRLTIDRDWASLDLAYRHAQMPGLSLHRVRYGAPVNLDVAQLSDTYLVQLTITGATNARVNGQLTETRAGDFSILSPGSSFNKFWHANTEQLMLRIDRHVLERAAASDLGDVRASITFEPTPISIDKAATLFRVIRMLCEEFDAPASPIERPTLSRSFVQLLVSVMLHTMPNDRQIALEHARSPAAPFYIKRAIEFIMANFADDITLSDIANASGASARALHKGFQRFRNSTPMEFLRSVRLDYARAELCKGRDRDRSVTSVAEGCGFRHLGRFAQLYAERFGETPSETLR